MVSMHITHATHYAPYAPRLPRLKRRSRQEDAAPLTAPISIDGKQDEARRWWDIKRKSSRCVLFHPWG